MSQEIAFIGSAQPAPGKLERIKEVLVETIKWMEANEPDTLEFSFYEEESEEGVKLLFHERYTSMAAAEKHQASEGFQKFFKTVMEEELLLEPLHFHMGSSFVVFGDRTMEGQVCINI